MHPKNLSIADFTYHLPADRIAAYPLPERDTSKLLILQNGRLQEDIYRNIDQYLPARSLLIFNDTKVVPARIFFQKQTGAQIELFCLEPHPQYTDIQTAMAQKGGVSWLCLIGGASKWKSGQVLEKKIRYAEKDMLLTANYSGKEKDCFDIEFAWTAPELSFAEVLQAAGVIPLPPYIKRNAEALDTERYQTIYADTEGSVAAPTAGLHFTETIFEKLNAAGIHRDFVTLHVGAGTFKPVKSDTMSDHEMHTEFIDVTASAIQNILSNLSNTVTAVGTTSLRTIESLYWLGLKLVVNPHVNPEDLTVGQWYPYETDHRDVSAATALEALLEKMREKNMQRLLTRTSLLIAPGYPFKIANALVTNFHQPCSTLLLLVAAFAGKAWRSLYDYALENNFRFLSYGDGSLLFRG